MAAAACHITNGSLAQLRAIEIQANTVGKFRRAWLVEASHSTVQACDLTRVTGVETFLIGLVRHRRSPGWLAYRHGMRTHEKARTAPCAKEAGHVESQMARSVRTVIGPPCGGHVRFPPVAHGEPKCSRSRRNAVGTWRRACATTTTRPCRGGVPDRIGQQITNVAAPQQSGLELASGGRCRAGAEPVHLYAS